MSEIIAPDTKMEAYMKTNGATTRLQIFGFYSYAIAFLPYTLAIGNIVPPMIEALSVRSGFEASNHNQVCNYMKPNYKCVVMIGGVAIPTTSFALYASALTVVIQALILIFFGALADSRYYRQFFILLFTILGGAFGTIYFLLPDPSYYWAITLFSIVANVGSAVASAYYYSYLPVLTRNHPEVLEVSATYPHDNVKLGTVRELVGNRLSSNSLALGLVAGAIVLAAAGALSVYLESPSYALQIGASMAGAWWLVIGLVAWLFLPKVKGPKLPWGRNFFNHSILQLYNGFKEASKANYIWLTLWSWFFISDGLSTILSVTIFVGRSSLGVQSIDTLFLSAGAPIAEAIGVILLTWIRRKCSRSDGRPYCSTKWMSIILTFVSALFALWGLAGYYTNSFGLQSKVEYYVYFILIVTLYASLQSFHRVTFAELVPKGRESEYFSIYLIAFKGTSWIGSLVVGAITTATGEIRLGYYFVIALFLAGTICLLFVNVDKARIKAKDLEK